MSLKLYPGLSACLHRRGAPNLGLSLWASGLLQQVHNVTSCIEGPRAGCKRVSIPCRVSLEQSRGAESPPSPCWPCCFGCSPGCGRPSVLPAHIAGSCWASSISTLKSFAQGCSQSFLCLAYTCTQDCLNPCAPCIKSLHKINSLWIRYLCISTCVHTLSLVWCTMTEESAHFLEHC